MIISTPVSLGELVDKISILHIKNLNIKDSEKLKLVKEVRDQNPGGPYKKILREQHGMEI